MLHSLVIASALALTGPQVGSPAPDFTLTTVAGAPVSLADLRGKTVVINVWGTWCPPCRRETPDLIAAARAAGGGDVAFLGVDSTESAPIVRAFVASKGVPYPQAIDGQKQFATAYDVTAFPTTLVIGPDGVLRARFVGEISPAILAGFISDARAGRNGIFVSDAQKKVDAMLAPAAFSFDGDLAARRAAARRVLDTIDAADAVDGDTDYLRSLVEENALRDSAARALAPLATAPADIALVARLQGDAQSAREQWDAALAAYRRGLDVAPDDVDLLDGYASALHGAGRFDDATDAYARLAEVSPTVEHFVDLGEVAGRAGRFRDGAAAFARAIGTARAAVLQNPHDHLAVRHLAWAYLYEGRMFALAGDDARARAAFAQTASWTATLPHTDSRYAMYLEEAQEATIALDARRPDGRTALSLAPWTGPDLPGSIASTLKYRLVVAGAPGKTIALSTGGLPKGWVASFCSDRQCAPFRSSIALPSSGVKVIEFQIVPENRAARAPLVRVDGDGASASVQLTARG
jgi:thiol-disulfide isomerase/thioredoxin